MLGLKCVTLYVFGLGRAKVCNCVWVFLRGLKGVTVYCSEGWKCVTFYVFGLGRAKVCNCVCVVWGG